MQSETAQIEAFSDGVYGLFTHIRKADNGLLFANLLLLLGVTVVPWPTSLLAARLGKPDQLAAAVVFNGTYFFLAIFFNVLWR